MMTPQQIETFFALLKQENPSPQPELIFKNPYELLVAVILSAQAKDQAVNRATAPLFTIANSPKSMVALGLEKLKSYVKTINLYPTKSKNIIEMSKILLEKHEGQVPANRKALEALPGVGRKTANVVLNLAFGQDTLAVDTHIFRVANRTGIARGKTVLQVEQALLKCIPAQYLHDAHHWLLLHGRYTCRARIPQCTHCPVATLCEFPDKTLD